MGIRRFASAVLAVALGAAALATAGGSAAAAGKPVKIKLLWLVETKGESVVATPEFGVPDWRSAPPVKPARKEVAEAG